MSSPARTRRRPSAAGSLRRPKSASFVRLSHLRKVRDCEQVGAVCYRIRKDRVEFLLIQTRRSRRWTFPKGSAEPGLTHAQAAALEAFEEAGVHGRIEEAAFTQYVCPRSAEESGRTPARERKINVHLCEVKRLCTPEEANRNRTWFSHQEARQRLREDRSPEEGTALARVIDRAALRIGRSLNEFSGKLIRQERTWATRQDSQTTLLRNARGRDPLHEVRFEWQPMLSSLVTQHKSQVRNFPSAEARPVLQAEILPFDPRERKRPKALAAGKSR